MGKLKNVFEFALLRQYAVCAARALDSEIFFSFYWLRLSLRVYVFGISFSLARIYFNSPSEYSEEKNSTTLTNFFLRWCRTAAMEIPSVQEVLKRVDQRWADERSLLSRHIMLTLVICLFLEIPRRGISSYIIIVVSSSIGLSYYNWTVAHTNVEMKFSPSVFF